MLNQVQHDELRMISGNYNVTLNLIQGLYFLKMKKSYTYIPSNKNRTVLYIGVTGDLNKRITEHKNGIGSDFTKKYNLIDLLYFEEYTDINQAISREKQLKNWRKEWKWDLIKDFNPELKDLFFEI